MAPPPPDPARFELVEALKKSNRRLGFAVVSLSLVAMTSAFTAFVSLNKPMPVVYRPDSPLDENEVIMADRAREVPTRAADAQRFMMRAGKLLHGWTSSSVPFDLEVATFLMTTKWRKHFLDDELYQIVDVPTSPGGKDSRLGYYVSLMSKNTLEWSSVSCERDAANRMWGCVARVTQEIQPLTGNPVPNPPRQNLIIRARFIEVPTTMKSIDGLQIDFWDVADADAKKPAATP